MSKGRYRAIHELMLVFLVWLVVCSRVCVELAYREMRSINFQKLEPCFTVLLEKERETHAETERTC